MQINETQLKQVDAQVKRLIALPDHFYGKRLREAGITGVSSVEDFLALPFCEKQDLREKVRERRSGCTLLFLVDASGSLGVRRRMSTVKGAILSMLRDSYVKRDRIGLMAFRRDSADMILPPTKSVEYSYKRLEELPTGGKTPLGEALVRVDETAEPTSPSSRGRTPTRRCRRWPRTSRSPMSDGSWWMRAWDSPISTTRRSSQRRWVPSTSSSRTSTRTVSRRA